MQTFIVPPIILVTITFVGPVPMSRRESPLVGYASSEDESAVVEPEGPPKKKR